MRDAHDVTAKRPGGREIVGHPASGRRPCVPSWIAKDNRDGWIAAANAYHGELLAGVEVSEDVEQFVTSHRRSLNDQAQALAERLSKAERADGESLDAAQGTGGAPASVRPGIRGGAPRADARPSSARPNQRRAAAVRAVQGGPAAGVAGRAGRRDQAALRLHSVIRKRRAKGTTEPRQARRQQRIGAPSAHPSIAIMPFDNLGDAVRRVFCRRRGRRDHVGALAHPRLLRHRAPIHLHIQGTVRGCEGSWTRASASPMWSKARCGVTVIGLRISVQLVDAVTRTQLWSDRYEGATTEIFAFQDRIAAQVAGALNPAIRHAEIEAARRKPPTSLRAYDLVMRAFPKLWGQNAAAINEAIPILRGRAPDRPEIRPGPRAARVVPRAQCHVSVDRGARARGGGRAARGRCGHRSDRR